VRTTLRIAAAVERDSEHTIAQGIVKSAEEQALSVPKAEPFEAIPGHGVRSRARRSSGSRADSCGDECESAAASEPETADTGDHDVPRRYCRDVEGLKHHGA
jgi:cation transport ATPase